MISLQRIIMKKIAFCFLVVFINLFVVHAEDGHQLWLRFDKSAEDAHLFNGLVGDNNILAVNEFQEAWKLLTGSNLPATKILTDKVLVIGT